ncbi:MAG: MerR family transcriptional regulator [Propionicimonas sp.]
MSISVFASATGLSVKTLRFYDERGLLPPAAVDPITGYRSYAASQLRQARTIRLLRAAGMSLELVERALTEADRLPELLSAHRAQLTAERERQDRALAIADQQGDESPLELRTRQVPATHWAAVGYQVDTDLDEADVDAVNAVAEEQLGRLFQALTQAGQPPIGQFWTAMPLTGGPGTVTVQLAWPIAAALPTGFAVPGLEIRRGTLPARTEAYVQLRQPELLADRLDDLAGGPLPDPTWIAFAEYCEASGAEPAELRQTTFGRTPGEWTVEYAATLAAAANPDESA